MHRKRRSNFCWGDMQMHYMILTLGTRIDYGRAEQMFNNGNVKPDEPTAIPCMWSQADVNKVAELFPRRPASVKALQDWFMMLEDSTDPGEENILTT